MTLAQYEELEHASIPTMQWGRFAKKIGNWLRPSFLRSTVLPQASTPWSWKEFLAKSIPITLILLMRRPPEKG